jgi:hypothetical protein
MRSTYFFNRTFSNSINVIKKARVSHKFSSEKNSILKYFSVSFVDKSLNFYFLKN